MTEESEIESVRFDFVKGDASEQLFCPTKFEVLVLAPRQARVILFS